MSGLENLHKNNIIHKDIKPENIVFDLNGYLYITDFGLSKIHNQNFDFEYSGTPSYMAPELLMKRKYDFSVDIYALGIILFEIMTQKLPYTGESQSNVFY